MGCWGEEKKNKSNCDDSSVRTFHDSHTNSQQAANPWHILIRLTKEIALKIWSDLQFLSWGLKYGKQHDELKQLRWCHCFRCHTYIHAILPQCSRIKEPPQSIQTIIDFYHPSTLIYHQSIIELHPPWRIWPSGIHSRACKSPNFQKSMECRERDSTGVRMKRSTLPNIVACRLQGASNYRTVSQSRPVINLPSSC